MTTHILHSAFIFNKLKHTILYLLLWYLNIDVYLVDSILALDFTELIWEIKILLRSIWSQRQTEAPWPQDPRSHLCCSSCGSLCFSKSGFSRMESQILSISFLGLAKTIESAHSRRLNMTRKEMNWSVPLKAVLNLLIFTQGIERFENPSNPVILWRFPPSPQ